MPEVQDSEDVSSDYYFSCPECDFEKPREGYMIEEPICPNCDFERKKAVKLEKVEFDE